VLIRKNLHRIDGYGLLAEQTFDRGFCPDLTRMDYYLHHLEITQPQLPSQVRYLTVDGAYAKEPFVTGVRALKLDVISKLRRDANLRYVFEGEQKARGLNAKQISTNRQTRFIISTNCVFKSNLSSAMLNSLPG
jgi:hypothetical protein